MSDGTLAEVFGHDPDVAERRVTTLLAENAVLRDNLSTFADTAADCGVPVEVVADAAAHTFRMLDEVEQVSLIEEALGRWKARMSTASPEDVIKSGDTQIIIANKRYQMRDDLIYRLMHEHFDLVYAYAVKLGDAPERSEWIFVTPRGDEPEVPTERTTKLMALLLVGLRRAKQTFEGVRDAALRSLLDGRRP